MAAVVNDSFSTGPFTPGPDLAGAGPEHVARLNFCVYTVYKNGVLGVPTPINTVEHGGITAFDGISIEFNPVVVLESSSAPLLLGLLPLPRRRKPEPAGAGLLLPAMPAFRTQLS